MAEIGIVASIIGVAGAGFRLSLILNAVSCEVANAPAEIHAISKNVHFFSLLLNQTAKLLDKADGVQSEDALDAARQLTEESETVFNEVNEMLDKVRTPQNGGATTTTLQQRFKFCFKRRKIEYLLSQLESLKISLSLMMQILQVGQLLASTSREDSAEKVQAITARVRKGRVEAQNTAIILHIQTRELQNLYRAALLEQEDVVSPSESLTEFGESLSLVKSEDSQGTLVETSPSIVKKSDTSVQPLAKPLKEIEEHWQSAATSQTEMIQTSNRVVDRLLERWTRWRQKKEEAEKRRQYSRSSARYRSAVDDLEDDEDEGQSPYFERFSGREDSPKGMYLEGPTTDWRQPHSVAARQDAVRRKRVYRGYQASVSAASSDVEDSPSSTSSKKHPSRRHVLNSDTESSESEKELPKPAPRRRSSAIDISGKPVVSIPSGLTSRSMSGTHSSASSQRQPSASTSQRVNAPAAPQPTANTRSVAPQRPWPNPNQSEHHHSVTTPLPPTHTSQHISGGTYAPPPVYAQQYGTYYPPTSYLTTPSQPYPPPKAQSSSMQRNNVPPLATSPGRYTPQQRPVSRDGKPPRSPSRLSQATSLTATPSSTKHKRTDEEKRAQRKETRRNLSDGATKGLLAGGGIAIFLEALDAFAI